MISSKAVEVGHLPARKAAQRRLPIAAPYSPVPSSTEFPHGLTRVFGVTRATYLIVSLALAHADTLPGARKRPDVR